MKIVALFFFCCLLVSSCCTDVKDNCSCDTSEVAKNDSILRSEKVIDWLPNFNKSYGQKMLNDESYETYRLLTTHSFSFYFQVYTISKTKEGGEFLTKEYANSVISQTGKNKLVYTHKTELNKSEWEGFKKVVEDNCFWTLPILDGESEGILDGGSWVIEGFQPYGRNCSTSNYIIVPRRDYPDGNGRFDKVYAAMMMFVDQKKLHIMND